MSSHIAVTVHIVEPLAITRAALTALLERAAGLRVVSSSTSAAESLTSLRGGEPAVLLTPPDLPDGSPAWLRQTLIANPNLKVVVLANPDDVEAAVGLVSAGASGCILTTDHPESLFEALRAAARGEMALSGEVARRLLSVRDDTHRAHASDLLSEREQEILSFLADGLTNKAIAQKLYLSVRTVEAHLRNIYSKIGVRSRLEAVLQSKRNGRPTAL
ncbi:MAG: LuxR C-terminal-related transcriptional regulator [Chloroflexota bacterium]